MSATDKLTHEVILDGGMFVDSQAGDCIRFFSKSRLKRTKQVIGPLVVAARSIDPRLLNLFLYSPILYQGCQRARMDAKDILEKFKAFAAMSPEDEGGVADMKQACLQIMADLIALEQAMDVAQTAAREGVDLENVDTFLNSYAEVRPVNKGDL